MSAERLIWWLLPGLANQNYDDEAVGEVANYQALPEVKVSNK